jgi:hypothetical protein
LLHTRRSPKILLLDPDEVFVVDPPLAVPIHATSDLGCVSLSINVSSGEALNLFWAEKLVNEVKPRDQRTHPKLIDHLPAKTAERLDFSGIRSEHIG